MSITSKQFNTWFCSWQDTDAYQDWFESKKILIQKGRDGVQNQIEALGKNSSPLLPTAAFGVDLIA